MTNNEHPIHRQNQFKADCRLREIISESRIPIGFSPRACVSPRLSYAEGRLPSRA